MDPFDTMNLVGTILAIGMLIALFYIRKNR